MEDQIQGTGSIMSSPVPNPPSDVLPLPNDHSMSRLPILGVNQGDGEESLRDGAIPKDDLLVAQDLPTPRPGGRVRWCRWGRRGAAAVPRSSARARAGEVPRSAYASSWAWTITTPTRNSALAYILRDVPADELVPHVEPARPRSGRQFGWTRSEGGGQQSGKCTRSSMAVLPERLSASRAAAW